MVLVAPTFIKAITWSNKIAGLTLFPFIFVSHTKYKDDVVLINHEKIHLKQQLELGIIFFFIWYLIEFLVRWIQFRNPNLAYRNIGFEKEAYNNEGNPGYLKDREFLCFRKYL